MPNLFPLNITLFKEGFTSVSPVAVTVKDAANLSRIFSSPPKRSAQFPKKRLPCWSPANYLPNTKRANDNVSEVTVLVYDFDHGKDSPDFVAKILRKKNIAFILHTTWSHRPSEPRYRMLLFLDRPLTPKEYPTAWAKGLRFMGYDAGVDRQARNISRHYALPAQVDGEEYVVEMNLAGVPLKSDEISKQDKKEERKAGEPVLKLDTQLILDTGEITSVAALMKNGEGKYKCTCPFQEDASPGSAFLRVMADGRTFLQCTSDRHDHEGKQFWLKNKTRGNRAARSVEDREQRLAEIPEDLKNYAERRLAYNATQGVFYRHAEGAWQISQPIRKDPLTDHFIGLLPKGCDKNHATAIIDHILSRQVYGFDCQSSRAPVVRKNEVPMLNLYAWPDLRAKAGKHSRVSEIVELLCAGDAQAVKWLMHWSAALVQHPERRAMVAVLVLSPQQGIGKSLYGRILAEIIGKGNSVVVSNKALRDNFNAHYVTSLLVLADEVGIDKKSADIIAEIKAAITDDRVHCSTPYAARTTVTNRMTWWLTSNKRRPFLVEQDDRRFTILSPGQAEKKYRKMLQACFDSKTSKFATDFYEEIQGYANYLKNLQIDWNLIARPYNTDAKKEIQGASMGSMESFTLELSTNGASETLSNYPPGPSYLRISEQAAASVVPCETLYGSYREYCTKNGKNDMYSENMLRLAIRDIPGVSVVPARVGGRKVQVYRGLPKQKKEEAGKVVSISPQQ
ncbi:MAG: putative primase [Prokaryotic dsDNA virus sp.]|nr:MAG: putative primase [Prokaryotic dsDNA virus sp.]|tara:strand:+ start:2561 stop:4768 length:2208 start_codon:yes stop_codon:yes gene_type:complete